MLNRCKTDRQILRFTCIYNQTQIQTDRHGLHQNNFNKPIPSPSPPLSPPLSPPKSVGRGWDRHTSLPSAVKSRGRRREARGCHGNIQLEHGWTDTATRRRRQEKDQDGWSASINCSSFHDWKACRPMVEDPPPPPPPVVLCQCCVSCFVVFCFDDMESSEMIDRKWLRII